MQASHMLPCPELPCIVAIRSSGLGISITITCTSAQDSSQSTNSNISPSLETHQVMRPSLLSIHLAEGKGTAPSLHALAEPSHKLYVAAHCSQNLTMGHMLHLMGFHRVWCVPGQTYCERLQAAQRVRQRAQNAQRVCRAIAPWQLADKACLTGHKQ